MTAPRPSRLCLALALAACLHAASPAEYRQHVGIYVWGQLAGGLKEAARDIAALGPIRNARVAIGPSWDPAGKPDRSPLDVKIRRADYRAFLAGFPVVMITAYDAASFEKYKYGALTAPQLAAVKDEFRRFTLELARTPGRRIVSNWEFENDCPAQLWAGCAAYYQARLDGVAAGRRQAKARRLPGEVLTAFEFTVPPGYVGLPSGLAEVGAKLRGLDLLAYSCWRSIGHDADAAHLSQDFAYAASFLRGWAAERKLTTRLIIGEFGEYWDMHPTDERMKALVDASIAGGVEYLFDWVLYEQPGDKDEWGRDASHFGKFGLDRKLTPQGAEFRKWFAQ
jgi:hypothetical protein